MRYYFEFKTGDAHGESFKFKIKWEI